MTKKRDKVESSERFAQLARCKRADTQSFDDAWVGLEPTFSDRRAVERWARMSAREGGEDAYFESKRMRRTVRAVGESIRKRYRARAKKGDPACVFAECTLEIDRDPWDVERANLVFRDHGDKNSFEVRFGMDPETFEFSIKPVPLAWLLDPRFVRFLHVFVWGVAEKHGLSASMAHGGGQYSISAKTYLQGSLLADDIATKLNHPELATLLLDYPNADDRSFRATLPRKRAFEQVLDAYWAGGFHPRANGPLTVANALLDRGFGPAVHPPSGLMDRSSGPIGDAREVFQTNFAFGRTVRWSAQNVDPGYWQSSSPTEDGYRPDQIMRYSEGNLNRLQIAGERHVKSGKLLDEDQIPELDAPLALEMLYQEASWENRGQMSRMSATDMVETVLLSAHHARHLLASPGVRVKTSLAQDRILGDAERTLSQRAPGVLAALKKAACEGNLAASDGRIKSDWVEPEALFYAAWRALGDGERGEIAREAISGLLEIVEDAAAYDPRRPADPMEAHRHRVEPMLWAALEHSELSTELARERDAWRDGRETYLARRPPWSVTDARPPWEE